MPGDSKEPSVNQETPENEDTLHLQKTPTQTQLPQKFTQKTNFAPFNPEPNVTICDQSEIPLGASFM